MFIFDIADYRCANATFQVDTINPATLLVVVVIFFLKAWVSSFPLKFKDKSCHFYLPFMVLVLISSCCPDGDGLDLLAPKDIGDSI